MTRDRWLLLLIVLLIASVAVGKEPTKQTLKVENVEITIEDETVWEVVPMGSTSWLIADDLTVSFMDSPLTGCDNVIKRLGNSVSNDFGPGWHKKASKKDSSVTVCLDLKDRTLLAQLTTERPSDSVYKKAATVLKELAKALKA